MVSQEMLGNIWWLIAELVGMEREGRYGMSRARMDSIRGFLVYVFRKYGYITPYLKGFNLTLEIWIPYRYD